MTNKTIIKGLLLDILEGDSYICQLHYPKSGFPRLINGKIVETWDARELKDFVEQQRPSLKYRNYHIEPSNQKILK